MLNITLIDDDTTILLVTEALLKNENYINDNDTINSLTSISNLDDYEILNLVKNTDIVICDHDLGSNSIEGLDFLKKLKSFQFKGLLVLLTGDESYNMRARIDSEDNIHYVIKNIESSKNGTINQLGNLISNFRDGGMIKNYNQGANNETNI